MECSLPMDGRRVSLTQLSKDSFRECQASLTLTDLLIIIFSGISVSVVAIMTSFFLASTVHCFQRWSKGTKGDEEESEEWGGRGGGLLRSLVPGNSDGCEDFTAGGGGVHNCHTASALWSIQDCLTVGSCPHTVTFFFCTRTSQVRRRRTFQRNELQLQSTQIILFLCFLGGCLVPTVHLPGSWLCATGLQTEREGQHIFDERGNMYCCCRTVTSVFRLNSVGGLFFFFFLTWMGKNVWSPSKK